VNKPGEHCSDYKLKKMKMKKATILYAAAFALMALCSGAQLPVSTIPQNSRALLEHFYGYKCPFSPIGDTIAEAARSAHAPGMVQVVNIHNFYNYSAPGPGWPDYQTPEGNQIRVMPLMNCNAIPAGPVNRRLWKGLSALSLNRNVWKSYIDSALNRPAYANIAVQGVLDINTRILTIEVEVFYTKTAGVTTNSLHIMLLEDKVAGPQSGSYYPSNRNKDGTYNHNNMLRKCITPVYGETIPATYSGYQYANTYTYSVPATHGHSMYPNTIKLHDLKLVAFVTETYKEVINVAGGPIKLAGFTHTFDLAVSSLKTPSLICTSLAGATFKLRNEGSAAVTNAVFSYQLNDGVPLQAAWTGTANPLSPDQTVTIPMAIQFNPLSTNVLKVEVVKVNGETDHNPANNSLVSQQIHLTDAIAPVASLHMEFTQDQYGEECKWQIVDENSGNVIESDGPWHTLPVPGVLLHTKDFVLPPGLCYRLVVTDSKGNGINGSTGSGKYVLSAGNTIVLNSDGKFAAGETKPFRFEDHTSLPGNHSISAFKIFPNPSASATNLILEVSGNQSGNITVTNLLGDVITGRQPVEFIPGENKIEIITANWPDGVYIVKVSTGSGSCSRRFVVAR
jgi:hypothetical protein